MDACGCAATALGDVQRLGNGNNTIALPGGRDNEGVLNVLGTGPLGRNGYDTRELAGSSYMQVVDWNGGEAVADALLTCGQQADPGAPHARDQTVRYAAGHWIRLPFTPTAIAAEPHKRTLHLVAP